jgi:hypothetical protein
MKKAIKLLERERLRTLRQMAQWKAARYHLREINQALKELNKQAIMPTSKRK